ncbi:MAG: hypothetical protein IJC18_01060 [Clostridia bacterium]|nr:hypothetical protein [Clostridia bacterium]
MNKKQAFRGIAFMLIAAFIVLFLCDVFEFQSSYISERYKTFCSLPEDTVDAVYIGSSAVDRYWMPSKAFEERGMTVYPLSSDGLPVWLVKNMIVEAYKHQNPRLVIIDIRSFTFDQSLEPDIADTRARRIIDTLGFFSGNRQDAIRRTLDVMTQFDPTISKHDPSYFLSVIRYHGKWADGTLKLEDITDPPSDYLGFYMIQESSVSTISMPETSFTDARLELDRYSEYYLHELLDYLRANDIDALFVDAVRAVTAEEAAKCNTVFDILSDAGYNYVNFNDAQARNKYEFDYEKDFYERGHTNYYGALKYTDYFSHYLSEHYDLPDRRDDERCADWYGVTEVIAAQIAEWEKSAGEQNNEASDTSASSI